MGEEQLGRVVEPHPAPLLDREKAMLARGDWVGELGQRSPAELRARRTFVGLEAARALCAAAPHHGSAGAVARVLVQTKPQLTSAPQSSSIGRQR